MSARKVVKKALRSAPFGKVCTTLPTMEELACQIFHDEARARKRTSPVSAAMIRMAADEFPRTMGWKARLRDLEIGLLHSSPNAKSFSRESGKRIDSNFAGADVYVPLHEVAKVLR